ncbi:MAG: PilZ domain-containing protein [Spirochaetales bacterium]|nr:PilZ domain-containing protein [Spirochaetales bacterium]
MKRKNNLPIVKVDVVINLKKKVKARVKNMIDRGICILTCEPLEKGKVFILEISYQGREKLKIKGKVMWSLKICSETYENGIDFLYLNINIKEELVRSVN